MIDSLLGAFGLTFVFSAEELNHSTVIVRYESQRLANHLSLLSVVLLILVCFAGDENNWHEDGIQSVFVWMVLSNSSCCLLLQLSEKFWIRVVA